MSTVAARNAEWARDLVVKNSFLHFEQSDCRTLRRTVSESDLEQLLFSYPEDAKHEACSQTASTVDTCEHTADLDTEAGASTAPAEELAEAATMVGKRRRRRNKQPASPESPSSSSSSSASSDATWTVEEVAQTTLESESLARLFGVCCVSPKLAMLAKENARIGLEAPIIEAETTTLMVRNVANRVRQAELLDTLCQLGLVGCVDFLYLPVDFRRGTNLGYFFVNFTSTAACEEFAFAVHGRKFATGSSKKTLHVAASRLQGLAALVENFRAAPVMEGSVPAEFKPLVLDCNGLPLPQAWAQA
mmetsp:Transcript_45903/g.121358  ORF Transcript_45903/g.121358 Transcript_45903/m.121358 type:complete len:304 (-) Transcript_45903:708-1619(-)